jgi:hypothetical protein
MCEELEDGHRQELVDRIAHDLGHAPVGVPGAAVGRDPYALVGRLEDLAVQQRLGLALGKRPRPHHRHPCDGGRQGESFTDEPHHRVDPFHVGVVVEPVAGGRPFRLEELEAALPCSQRAHAHAGSPCQFPDAHRHCATVRNLYMKCKSSLSDLEGISCLVGEAIRR